MGASKDASILVTTREYCGIIKDCSDFDSRLIPLINTALSKLWQLGVGTEGFEIDDDSTKWSDFTHGNKLLNLVQSYVHISVLLLFDPPANSFAVTSMKETLDELTWRINVIVDPKEINK